MRPMQKVKKISIYIMGFFYVYIGVKHFLDPDFFIAIMPKYMPFHYELVLISGFFEIMFGLMLMFEKYRSLAAWGLILLLIAVFPANIYLYQSKEAQEAIDISKDLALYRLPFQLLFLGLAYWHSKVKR